jgi:PBP1b-binding outer membrane lipoprotein LpoB
MKTRILSILILSTVILSGCASKGTSSSGTSNIDENNKASIESNAQVSKDSNPSTVTTKRVEPTTDFKEVKPGTVPQLSTQQKTQVNTKLNSTVKDLSNVLKSIQDAQDIDLSSVN